jgi:hypothetical protein
VNLIGIFFQIADDYLNLQSDAVSSVSAQAACTRLTLPIREKVQTKQGLLRGPDRREIQFPDCTLYPDGYVKPANAQFVSFFLTLNIQLVVLIFFAWADVLRQRPTDDSIKAYAVSYMNDKTRSFEYTREVLKRLEKQARDEIERLGGNVGLSKFLDKMSVPDPEIPGTASASASGEVVSP